jgi:hypothetical protein
MTTERRPHVLIIEQAVPLRHDRRVRMQSQALLRAGFRVSVIAPKAAGDRSRCRVEGVDVYSFRALRHRHSTLGLTAAALYSWLRVAWLSLLVWHRRPFDVLQGGNPPDTSWVLARAWGLRGVRFLYDQRELGPERYLARFGLPGSPVGKVVLGCLRWLERRSYAAADHVVVGNELYQEIAARRGGRDLEDSTVVRSAPDTWPRPAISVLWTSSSRSWTSSSSTAGATTCTWSCSAPGTDAGGATSTPSSPTEGWPTRSPSSPTPGRPPWPTTSPLRPSA